MEDKFWIYGDKIALRPITEDDTDLVVKWRNNERIRGNFVYRVSFTRQIHENWLHEKVMTGQVIQMIICENTDEKRPVGSVYFKYLDETKTQAEYGIFIGEDDAVGKGYGNETAIVAVDYARTIGIRRVILRAFTYNQVAIKSYENAGFRKYEDLPQVECSDGSKSNMILMEKLL